MGVVSCFPGAGKSKIKATAYASAASLPASAKAGDVAVITATAIGKAFAQAAAPSAPAAGDIWIWTGSHSLGALALTDTITLYPRAVYQYISAAWVFRVSYVYTTVWKEVSLYVYDSGSDILSVMAQVNYGYNTANTIYNKDAGSIRIVQTGSTTTYRLAHTETQIDLTGVSQIKLTYTRNKATSYDWFGVTSWRGDDGSFVTYGTLANGTGITKTIDVSALTGLYYLGLRFHAAYDATSYIHRIELIR